MYQRFKYWFDNTFWYHYKWPTIATLTGLALVVYFVVSLVTAVDDDMSVIFVTTTYSDEAGLMQLEELVGQEIGDVNGDEKLSYGIQVVTITDDEMGYANQQKLMALYTQAENGLYFYDADTKSGYLQVGDDVFLDMTEYGYESVPGYPGLVDVSESPYIKAMFPWATEMYAAVRLLSEKQQQDPALVLNQELSVKLIGLLMP